MPSRAEIKPRVIEKLQAITDQDELAEKESSKLGKDLGMSNLVKKAMAMPYTNISTSYEGGLKVTLSAAAECKTVGDAIDLVHKRANGDAS